MLDKKLVKEVKRNLNIYDEDYELSSDDIDAVEELEVVNTELWGEEKNISLIGLEEFKNLSKLELVGFNLNNEVVDEIWSLKGLEVLNLRDCIGTTLKLPNLKELYLDNLKVDNLYFEQLPERYVLENIDNTDIVGLLSGKSDNIEQLRVINSVFKQMFILKSFERLKLLELYGVETKDKDTISYLSTKEINIVIDDEFKPIMD